MPTIRPVLHSVKTLKPVTVMLRELGVRLVIYIDDILIMVKTKELAKDHTLGLIHLLENLGFIVHPVKSVTISTQEIVSGNAGQLTVSGTGHSRTEAK